MSHASFALADTKTADSTGAASADPAPAVHYPLSDEFVILAPAPLDSIAHSTSSFTQGLFYEAGVLYESTGLYGQSTLNALDAATGQVIRSTKIEDQYFAEGLSKFEDRLFQLTWRSGEVFEYQQDSFAQIATHHIDTEGWGIDYQAPYFYVSDGTSKITRYEPEGFKRVDEITVTAFGQPIDNINEMEFIGDKLWANIWQTRSIAVIDPASGQIEHEIRFGLPLPEDRRPTDDVLNGIAYNAASGDIYITGKNFAKIYRYNIRQFGP